MDTAALACILPTAQGSATEPSEPKTRRLRSCLMLQQWRICAIIRRMIPKTPVDFTGDGHQHTLASILGVTKCKWFQVIGTAISTPGRVGDSGIEVSGGGFPIATGGGQFSPPIAFSQDFYDLTKWYIILTSSDTASVGCAL